MNSELMKQDKISREEEWGSEKQIDAQNRFFEIIESMVTKKQMEDIEEYAMKATTEEMQDYALKVINEKS